MLIIWKVLEQDSYQDAMIAFSVTGIYKQNTNIRDFPSPVYIK